jgi:hypothetical protein
MNHQSTEVAVFLVGGLLLEQAPKAVIMTDEQLESYYEPALQNFQDFMVNDHRTVFTPDPPEQFRQMVLDHVRRYLDMRRMRYGL